MPANCCLNISLNNFSSQILFSDEIGPFFDCCVLGLVVDVSARNHGYQLSIFPRQGYTINVYENHNTAPRLPETKRKLRHASVQLRILKTITTQRVKTFFAFDEGERYLFWVTRIPGVKGIAPPSYFALPGAKFLGKSPSTGRFP